MGVIGLEEWDKGRAGRRGEGGVGEGNEGVE